MKDYQRSRVYAWENQAWFALAHTEMMTIDEIISFTTRLVPGGVRVKDGRRRRRAGGCYFSKTIWMPRWSRRPHIVCHEVAHTIVSPHYHSWHGARFMREYILCLWRGGLIGSPRAARMDAIDFGLKVGEIQ